MSEWMWLGVIFASVFVVSFGLLQWANAQRERVRRRRLQGGPGEQPPDSTPDMVLGSATDALAGQLPITGEKRVELRSELQQAGFYRRSALQEYAAIRAVLIFLPILAAGLLALLVEPRFMLPVLFGGLILAGLGYSLPRVYINSVARRRRRQIEKALPVAVDLLALGLLSGQNILLALRRVSTEMKRPFPVLAEELEIVREQAELNTLPHALSQFAERVQLAEVRNLAIILTQSQRQGSDAAPALMEFASNFRVNLRQRAEAQANRAGFWLVFPSIFCLWVPAFIVLVGPIFFEFYHKRQEAGQLQEPFQLPNRRPPASNGQGEAQAPP
jgi:tight adherence protein C